MAVVTGYLRTEVELVLSRANLADFFQVIVAGDDVTVSKPKPDPCLLALDILNQQNPGLNLQSSECLVIEDTFAASIPAKLTRMPVVGVAHTYPFHLLQPLANWCVDYLSDLELDRVQNIDQEITS